MTLFELAKQNICVPDAAEYYGLQVNRNVMCSCPFHEDRHPSMKLNERYFYCFGCGATGDVIDLVARLFDLSSYEAAQKLAQDFGIDPDKPLAAIALPKPERPLLKAYRQEEVRCLRVLCDYLHLLEGWKQNYAPANPDDSLDDRFVEACQMLDYVEYLADLLIAAELDAALNEYAGLREQAQSVDPVQLYEARQAIRPGKEQEAENRAQRAYGEKYSPLLMFDSKKAVFRMLHKDMERQAVRRIISQYQREQQISSHKRKSKGQER